MKLLYKKVLSWLTGGSLFIVFAVVLGSSLSRYALNAPIQWSEEIAKYAMIYGAMFGTILCYLEGIHIRFGFVADAVPVQVQRLFNILVDITTLGSGVVLVWSGYLFVLKRGGILATGTGLPMYVFQSAMIVGGIGLTLAALIKLMERFGHRTEAQAQPQQSE
ncbi:TRAP transporter small permease [Marinobacterium aestuariivivens]|uniref:TRAP transporter small permease protein n=1 Tax=Marinobacterium aestuariivivens TaxID=1698799 RepID=A0ABW2A753_9GAMM